jgi:hypothetical protein
MKTVRLYRKEPNSAGNSDVTRYRIARNNGLQIINPIGQMLNNNSDYWTLWVEGEEERGAVYSASWSEILKKYDVVEELPDSPNFSYSGISSQL